MKSPKNYSSHHIYLFRVLCVFLIVSTVSCRSYCPFVLERMRMCRRTDYTAQDLETLREKPVELDPNLMKDIESAIKGMEAMILPSPSLASSSTSTKPRSPVVPSSPPSSTYFTPEEESGAVPSPYISSSDAATGLQYMPSIGGLSPTSATGLRSLKTRKIINVISNWIDEDNRYNKRTSKTAKVIGHIAGDLVGMIVNERFRQIGTAVGDLARTGVKELTVAGLDNVLRLYNVAR